MKKIFFIIFAATSFVACKKDNDTEIIPVNTAEKIKTQTFDTETTSFTYDSYGRQVLALVNDGSKTETIYSKGKVTRKVYIIAGVLRRTDYLEVNKNGQVIKLSVSDHPGDYTTYEYGPDKQLVKTFSKIGTDTHTSISYYNNGILDSIRYDKNNVWNLTNIFTYYTDKPNMLAPANNGTLYNPDNYKFMIKSLTHVGLNGVISPENYSFEYDVKGRVTKLTELTPNGTSIGYYTY